MSRPSSITASTSGHAVVQYNYAPAARDTSPPEFLVDHQDTLATSKGGDEKESIPDDACHHCDEQLAGGGKSGSDDPTAETAVGGGSAQDVATNNNPSRFDDICGNLNHQHLEECTDLLLELLGWGVPLEYITDSGFSLPGVIWLCAKLKIRLSWGIVMRARQACIPLHELSILPEGYVRPKPRSSFSFSPPPDETLVGSRLANQAPQLDMITL